MLFNIKSLQIFGRIQPIYLNVFKCIIIYERINIY